MPANGFLSAFGVVSQDFRLIRKRPKSADFEEKPGLWPMVLNMVDLVKYEKSFQTR